jgi:hypothetical protein
VPVADIIAHVPPAKIIREDKNYIGPLAADANFHGLIRQDQPARSDGCGSPEELATTDNRAHFLDSLSISLLSASIIWFQLREYPVA